VTAQDIVSRRDHLIGRKLTATLTGLDQLAWEGVVSDISLRENAIVLTCSGGEAVIPAEKIVCSWFAGSGFHIVTDVYSYSCE
jgi:hypothetical protein